MTDLLEVVEPRFGVFVAEQSGYSWVLQLLLRFEICFHSETNLDNSRFEGSGGSHAAWLSARALRPI